MPENPDYEVLVSQMRESSAKIAGFDLYRGHSPESRMLGESSANLQDGATAIEALLKQRAACLNVVDKAFAVFRASSEKGMLFVTEPETGSDKLVGFFCPPDPMVDLGKAACDADDAVWGEDR